MINLRILSNEENLFKRTEPMGFYIVKKHQQYDTCVRILGAAQGKLAFFDEPKTTTINIKYLNDQAKSLLESVELLPEDFKYSVSVPYVDTTDFVARVEKHYEELENTH